jgi:Zn-dependent oligopeptidase
VGEDYTQLWNDLREKISLVKYDKPCPGQASFGHITGGYDAGYYGYVSKDISVDVLLTNFCAQVTRILLSLPRICMVRSCTGYG